MEKSILKTGINGIVSDSNRYKTDKGEISLLAPCIATMDTYEIYCCKGDLFDDIERYDTIVEAEERINELLK